KPETNESSGKIRSGIEIFVAARHPIRAGFRLVRNPRKEYDKWMKNYFIQHAIQLSPQLKAYLESEEVQNGIFINFNAKEQAIKLVESPLEYWQRFIELHKVKQAIDQNPQLRQFVERFLKKTREESAKSGKSNPSTQNIEEFVKVTKMVRKPR
ncbi:unnamed protein product, partial [Didymodactylos carnosus]